MAPSPQPAEQTPLLGSASSNGAASPSTPADGADVESGDLFTVRIYPSDGFGLSPGAQEAVSAAVEEEHDANSDSPYLAGVGVARFWLIFGGVLLQYFVNDLETWMVIMARVSDTVGRRPVYLFSLAMFVLTTAWCALARSIGSFIAARAFCGLGAGGVLAMGHILANDLVPIEIRGNYEASIALFYGLGQACGAAFGGFLCDTLGWRWTFGVQIPAQLLILVLAVATVPASLGPHLAKHSDESVFEHVKSFDLAGSSLLTTSVAFMILGLNLGGNVLSWSHPFVTTSLIVSVIAGALLVRVESKAARPVVPLAMLSTAPRGQLVFSNLFADMASSTVVFNAPLYYQAVKLDSASQSGFRMAAPSLAIMICGVCSGLIMTWTRRMKPLLVVGSLIALAGAICLTCMWDGMPTWLATIFVVPVSTGLGLSFPATSLAVLATSAQEDQAMMTSTLSLFRSLGSVFGVAISSLIVQNALTVDLEKFVTGPKKAEIILLVRKSVRAVFDLSKTHQMEVIHAYEHSLRYAFASAIILLIVVNALVMPIKLPRLGNRKR